MASTLQSCLELQYSAMADQQKEFFSDIKNEFKELGSKVNKLFDEMVRGKGAEASYHVVADIYETSDSVVYELDLPGVAKTDFSVQVRDNRLLVRGRRARAYDGGVKEHLTERGFGEFTREFIVPAGVDTTQTKAKLDNGVLRISLPKQVEEIESAEVNVE
jgi:HSP20 family protein